MLVLYISESRRKGAYSSSVFDDVSLSKVNRIICRYFSSPPFLDEKLDCVGTDINDAIDESNRKFANHSHSEEYCKDNGDGKDPNVF
jgi:hypothetical protein